MRFAALLCYCSMLSAQVLPFPGAMGPKTRPGTSISLLGGGNDCSGETCNPYQVFGSGTASAFLTAAAQQRRQLQLAGHNQRTNARWAAEFMS